MHNEEAVVVEAAAAAVAEEEESEAPLREEVEKLATVATLWKTL